MNTSTQIFLIVLSLAVVFFLIRSFLDALGLLWSKVTVKEHNVVLHHLHGKFQRILTPGRHAFFGKGHAFEVIETRLQPFSLQTQELNTAEGISIKATVVGFYKITDPIKATEVTTDRSTTIYTQVQLALRDVLSGVDAENLLAGSKQFSVALLEKIAPFSKDLGIEFSSLHIRDLILPNDIKSVLTEAWRAKKHSLAELEAARGKAAATRTLANVAKFYETNPVLLQVRYLEALEKAAEGMGNTFVIGMENEKALALKK